MGNQNQMGPRRAFLAPEVMSCKSHWWPEILLEGPEPRPELRQGGRSDQWDARRHNLPGGAWEPQACLPEVALLLASKFEPQALSGTGGAQAPLLLHMECRAHSLEAGTDLQPIVF